MLRILLLITFAMIGAAFATPFSDRGSASSLDWADVVDEISRFEAADRLCRGSLSQDVSDSACLSRDAFDFEDFARRTGWCLGRINDSPAQFTWHLCSSGSIGRIGSEPQTAP